MTTDLLGQLQASLGTSYVLERELGGGGMSRVFLAEERPLGRRVVLKILSPDLAAGLSTDRFQREIRLAAQLQDPRIVPLLNAGEAAGLPYYTMPYVEGQSLRTLLHGGAVPRHAAITILRDIALALEYAHARGIVHRDIKPENVLLSGRTAVVTDFGIAKAISAATSASPGDSITALGAVVGTPAYMAPEQAAGGMVDHRSDLYAWGVIGYELLAGKHPFAGRTTAQAIVAAHIAESPARLGDQAPDLPSELVTLVDRCLSKDPAQRPAGAAEVVRTLDRLGGRLSRPEPLNRGRARLALSLLALVILSVSLLLWRRRDPEPAPQARAAAGAGPRSVAVLPFSNLGGDTANTYFAAGMADELITALSRVPGLRVASRSSAFRFRTDSTPLSDVARRLEVEAVLEGTVRRSGDRIRGSARLINGSDGATLWAGSFDSRTADVFDVQDSISHSIVTSLRGTLIRLAGTADSSGGAPRGTADLAAYDLYLKGRYYWGKRGREGLRTAIDYFEQAVARDPRFARGYAGLSMAQVVLPVFLPGRPDSLLVLASRNAELALSLDSTLADAHLAIGYARKMQWRWTESERHFRDALTLAPYDGGIHHWYGVLLYAIGRIEEAVEHLSEARRLDPLAGTIGSDGAIALYGARRYQEALAEVRRDQALDSTKSDVHLIIGLIHLALARPDSALDAFRTSRRLGTGFDLRAYESVAHRRLNRKSTADSLYRDLLASSRRDPDLAFAVAIAAGAAGDRETGMEAIRQTINRRTPLVTEVTLPCDPLFDPLKPDPRFFTLLRGAGMQDCPPSR